MGQKDQASASYFDFSAIGGIEFPRSLVGLNVFTERCPSWPKERDWKSRVLLIVVPRVRIPLSPPIIHVL
jgi:hypothetical protein